MRIVAVFALLVYSALGTMGCREEVTPQGTKIKTIAKPRNLKLKRFGVDYTGERFPNNEFIYEIVVRVKADCLPCVMEMGSWQVFHQKVALPYAVRLTFYAYSRFDYRMFDQTMRDVLYSGLPVYRDSTDSFLTLNGLDPDSEPHCFLLRNDTVVLAENPIRSRESFNRVMEVLKKSGAMFDDFTLNF